MRLAFLPTGRTEWHGLPDAFRRLFPAHEFDVVPSSREVESYGDEYPLNGFTSARLRPGAEHAPPANARELVSRAARVLMDRRPPDHVFIVEDLELANSDQPACVIEVFRRAVQYHLGELAPDLSHRTRLKLRDQTSFHLVVPMIEAWLFGDREALRRAGVPAGVVPALVGSSLEEFQADEIAYSIATEHDCPGWARKRRATRRPAWMKLDGASRRFHPKAYLQWLCRDGEDERCTTYRESEAGGMALQGIEWSALFGHRGLAYLNALVEDVADALDEQVPLRSAAAAIAMTCRSRRPPDAVLRNL